MEAMLRIEGAMRVLEEGIEHSGIFAEPLVG
jgi:hypothetical protein